MPGRTPNVCNILGICADCISAYKNTLRPTGVNGGNIGGIEQNEPTGVVGYTELYLILPPGSFTDTRTDETR